MHDELATQLLSTLIHSSETTNSLVYNPVFVCRGGQAGERRDRRDHERGALDEGLLWTEQALHEASVR